MDKKRLSLLILICTVLIGVFSGCRKTIAQSTSGAASDPTGAFTVNTPIRDVINYPGFGDYGRLIFPVNDGYYSGSTLGTLSLTWYTQIRPEKTVEICNYMKEHADSGDVIFYDIYTDEEKAADPSKNDTGLFFFRGEPGAKFAIVSSGGGMVYVGSMHDSYPHALEISKKGYNAFSLIYRAGYQTGPEDCARAVAFIFEHADELDVDTSDYSLWGGSAGARIADWVGTNGTAYYGQKAYPQPAAVIMQYTALSEVTGNEPATYNCVGNRDGIAPYSVMQERINRISANGTDTMIEVFDGLSHGFGIGLGTVAEGWVDRAVAFWERQMQENN
ncbi:MAG: alpha/beta hydrolase [Lentisphaeria bacterium]|nr:alpha/beta hydrolase [Lentisphaeria bacterium]